MFTKGQHVIVTSGAFKGQHGVVVNAVRQSKSQPWTNLYRVAFAGMGEAWRVFGGELEAARGEA